MQLMIVQTEIEAAIEKHVREIIVIKDGMRIDIDLKATRGADGYQAIIDIVPETQARAVRAAEEHEQETVNVTKTVRAARAAPAATKTTTVTRVEPKKDPVIEQPTEAAQPVAESVEDQIPDGESPDEGSIAEQAAGANEPQPEAPKRPSLFGSLTKPENA